MFGINFTICILTHARTALLAEAVHSALQVKWDMPHRVLVVNDCPEQTIRIDHPQVRVANLFEVCSSIGSKRQWTVGATETDYICWLDDDDLLLPMHAAKFGHMLSSGMLGVEGDRGFWFDGERGEVKHASRADTFQLRSRVLLARYIDASASEDWDMCEKMRKLGRTYIDKGTPTYIERWGNGAYHVSGLGADPSAHTRFRAHALHLLSTGAEPTGAVNVTPRAPAFDFNAACAALLAERNAKTAP